jgi:hypothetical protein
LGISLDRTKCRWAFSQGQIYGGEGSIPLPRLDKGGTNRVPISFSNPVTFSKAVTLPALLISRSRYYSKKGVKKKGTS